MRRVSHIWRSVPIPADIPVYAGGADEVGCSKWVPRGSRQHHHLGVWGIVLREDDAPFVLLHELGHARAGHRGAESDLEALRHEYEAEWWAVQEARRLGVEIPADRQDQILSWVDDETPDAEEWLCRIAELYAKEEKNGMAPWA